MVGGQVNSKVIFQCSYKAKDVILCSKDHGSTEFLCGFGPRNMEACRRGTISQHMERNTKGM